MFSLILLSNIITKMWTLKEHDCEALLLIGKYGCI